MFSERILLSYTGLFSRFLFLEDIDECQDGTHMCGLNSRCHNTQGSYRCPCVEGYAVNGGVCSDINECNNRGSCHPHASCTNTAGTYSCRCNPGLRGDGISCSDYDECTSGDHDCDKNAKCSNNWGSYHCCCKKGFHGDGKECKGELFCPLVDNKIK